LLHSARRILIAMATGPAVKNLKYLKIKGSETLKVESVNGLGFACPANSPPHPSSLDLIADPDASSVDNHQLLSSSGLSRNFPQEASFL